MNINTIERPKAEASSEAYFLGRINEMLTNIDNAAYDIKIYDWGHGLAVLFRELSSEMKEDEAAVFDKRVLDTLKVVEEYKDMGDNIPFSLYNELHRLECDIRRVIKVTGLNIASKELRTEARL